ncbi:cytochrome P450 78A7 [Impatiens glandulifera]|uniref:cytochrome P450 78A7 n=1 Tax=Impatiens glandulifera TaxID=253017 RepID=UPI001FB12B92|nr:cytochrome P450 78A7 [Impatiens glandulifera]
MDFTLNSEDSNLWMFLLPAIIKTPYFNHHLFLLFILLTLFTLLLLIWALPRGGLAWKNGRNQMGQVQIPGPKGLPIFGSLFSLSHGLPHRTLASMAFSRGTRTIQLMALSLGSTPAVVASEPQIAREILTSPHFANRPIKSSARQLMFSRAIGFAPNGPYWRQLRRIASTHLFSQKRILAHEHGRMLDCADMVKGINEEQGSNGFVELRKHIQIASLNSMMGIVFGKKYERGSEEIKELNEIVREGFELLGGFNWSDHLQWVENLYDPIRVHQRCSALVIRVRSLIVKIIEEHVRFINGGHHDNKLSDLSEKSFVHVLLCLEGEEKLEEEDMVAVLWEMIFRGTDTTALLTEWVMAELVLNRTVQSKLKTEIQSQPINGIDLSKLPYLQAVVKETLRVHPPGPLLSWSRLSISDVCVSNGMVIPAGTTAMVNMWAICHDPTIWSDPFVFKPERFLPEAGGAHVDVRGSDMRLAPFGAGRRVCPGKNLGLATVSLWVAELVRNFEWGEEKTRPVDLSEVLKLSCEMENPLCAVAVATK